MSDLFSNDQRQFMNELGAASDDKTIIHNVCYIIPVYNNTSGLISTLNSVLDDSELPGKIYILDDGSKDKVELPKGFNSNLISLMRQDPNRGISSALNLLITEATNAGFQYAALIDAGDLACPGRLRTQIEAFKSRKDVVALGGDMAIIGTTGAREGNFSPPISEADIHKAFRRGYPFAHPTAMFQLAELRKYNIEYNPNILASVDYDFLYRIHCMNPGAVANIPETLVMYVRESNSIGIKKSSLQAREAYKIRLRNFDVRSVHSILGLLDIRLILRAISARAFFTISKYYRKLGRNGLQS